LLECVRPPNRIIRPVSALVQRRIQLVDDAVDHADDLLIDDNNFTAFEIEVVRPLNPKLFGVVVKRHLKGLPVDRKSLHGYFRSLLYQCAAPGQIIQAPLTNLTWMLHAASYNALVFVHTDVEGLRLRDQRTARVRGAD
jgi:hypothetical protein